MIKFEGVEEIKYPNTSNVLYLSTLNRTQFYITLMYCMQQHGR